MRRGTCALVLALAACASPPTSAPRDATVADDASSNADRAQPADAALALDASADVAVDLPPAPVDVAPLRGRFVRDEAAERALASGAGWTALTGSLREATSSLAVDLDGDGRDELVLNANLDIHGRSRQRGASWVARRGAAGQWAPEALDGGGGGCRVAADLDDDGAPDLLCTGPVARVYWNERGAFSASRATMLSVDGAAMTATARDLDDDGLADLVVGNWGDAPVQVFHNRGDRTFEEVGARWGLRVEGLVWAALPADLDDDGRDDLLVMGDGNAHENYALRALGPGPDGGPRFQRFAPSADAMTAREWFGNTNRGPMGAALAWLDDDAAPELVLASDFWGPGLSILTARAPGDWRLAAARFGLAQEITTTGQPLIPWSPRAWDVDRDGALDLLVPCGDDDGHGHQPNRGVSRALLFRQVAGGRLVEVADQVLPTQGQFMTPSLTDLDDDGDLDLVLGRFGAAWQVFRNELDAPGGALRVALTGAASAREAGGARVTVRAGGRTQRFVDGATAMPQATERAALEVGLGGARVDEVTLRWPSGYAQTLRAPAGPVLRVTEPLDVVLDPPSRHARADGASRVTVTVRVTDGAARPRVTLRAVVPADAAWEGPEETLPDGSVRRALRAPARPGSVVVAVALDGRELTLRPRVWFD